jgi:tetratricopeptide (TPR) repeat protein
MPEELARLRDWLTLTGDRAAVALVRGPDARLADVLAALPGAVCLPTVRDLPGVAHGALVLAGIDASGAGWLNLWRNAIGAARLRVVLWMPASQAFSLRAVATDLDSWVGLWLELPPDPSPLIVAALRASPRVAWQGGDPSASLKAAFGADPAVLTPSADPRPALPAGPLAFRDVRDLRALRRVVRQLAWHGRLDHAILLHPAVDAPGFTTVDDTTLPWPDAAAALADHPDPARAAAAVGCLRQRLVSTVTPDRDPLEVLPEADAWRAGTPSADNPAWEAAARFASDVEGEHPFAVAAIEATLGSATFEPVPGLRLRAELASYRLRAGDLAGARRDAESAYADLTQRLGDQHLDTLSALHVLAAVDSAEGHFAQASSRYQRALDVSTLLRGAEHPQTLRILLDLAVTLQHLGELELARQRCEQALDGLQKVSSPAHPDVLDAQRTLAAILHDQGRLAAARALIEQVVEVSTRHLGLYHDTTLSSQRVHYLVLRDQGELRRASELAEIVHASRAQLLGSDHPRTLRTSHDLAGLYGLIGDLVGAQELLEQTLAGRTHTLGPDHPDTLSSIEALAVVLHNRGDVSGAERLHSRALEGRTRTLGPTHPATLTTLHNLGVAVSDGGDLATARSHLGRALKLRKRVLGPDHQSTLSTQQNLAHTLLRSGELKRARALFEETLRARTRVLGSDHPDTRRTRYFLVHTLLQLSNRKAARPHLAALAVLDTLPDADLSASDRRIRDALPSLRARLP